MNRDTQAQRIASFTPILPKGWGRTQHDGVTFMRKAYLHIGLEKTGTTSLQIFLKENTELLAKYKLEYLGHEAKPYVHGIGHFPIAASFQDECPDFIPLQKYKPSSEVLQALSQDAADTDSDIILSCEHFSSELQDIEYIKALGDALSPREIKVVCYLRRHDEQAISHYSTLVKGGLTEPFNVAGITPECRYYNYRQILEDWSEVFGRENIIVREYDRKVLVKGDTCADFLSILGIDIEGASSVGDRNTSLDSLQVEMLRRINQHLPPFVSGGSEHDLENYQKSQDIRVALIPTLPEGAHISALVSNTERQKLMNQFESENFKILESFPEAEFIKKWHNIDMKNVRAICPANIESEHFERALIDSGAELMYRISECESLERMLNEARVELQRLKVQMNKPLLSKAWKRIKEKAKLSRR